MLHIYDISSLKVNNLTLILLTWRKWRAPNNASKQHMGFNSGFKGLKSGIFSSARRNYNYTRRPVLGRRDEALCAFCLGLRPAIHLEEKCLQPAAGVVVLSGKLG